MATIWQHELGSATSTPARPEQTGCAGKHEGGWATIVTQDRGSPLKREWAAGDSSRKLRMASEEHPPDDIALPMAWVGFDDAPILFANQFLGQHQPGEAIITIGQATAPPLVGTPEEVRAQARELTYIAVRPLVRLGLTKARLQELIAVLEITKLRMEAAEGEADPLK